MFENLLRAPNVKLHCKPSFDHGTLSFALKGSFAMGGERLKALESQGYRMSYKPPSRGAAHNGNVHLFEISASPTASFTAKKTAATEIAKLHTFLSKTWPTLHPP